MSNAPTTFVVTIPVFMPAWIVQDGAHPYPDDGTQVRYRLNFIPIADSTGWQKDCLFTGHAEPRLLSSDGDAGRTRDGEQRPPQWPTVLGFGHFEAFTILDTPRTTTGVVTGLLAVDYELGASPVGPIRGRVERRRLLTEVSAPVTHTLIATELAPLTVVEPPFRDGLVHSDHVIEREGHRYYATAPPTDRPWRRDTGILLDITLNSSEHTLPGFGPAKDR